jgi:hypothetical protein
MMTLPPREAQEIAFSDRGGVSPLRRQWGRKLTIPGPHSISGASPETNSVVGDVVRTLITYYQMGERDRDKLVAMATRNFAARRRPNLTHPFPGARDRHLAPYDLIEVASVDDLAALFTREEKVVVDCRAKRLAVDRITQIEQLGHDRFRSSFAASIRSSRLLPTFLISSGT